MLKKLVSMAVIIALSSASHFDDIEDIENFKFINYKVKRIICKHKLSIKII